MGHPMIRYNVSRSSDHLLYVSTWDGQRHSALVFFPPHLLDAARAFCAAQNQNPTAEREAVFVQRAERAQRGD